MKGSTRWLLRVAGQTRTRLTRMVCDLRGRIKKHRRDVNTHLIRGVSYGVGSGAVSLLVIWIQSRY